MSLLVVKSSKEKINHIKNAEGERDMGRDLAPC